MSWFRKEEPKVEPKPVYRDLRPRIVPPPAKGNFTLIPSKIADIPNDSDPVWIASNRLKAFTDSSLYISKGARLYANASDVPTTYRQLDERGDYLLAGSDLNYGVPVQIRRAPDGYLSILTDTAVTKQMSSLSEYVFDGIYATTSVNFFYDPKLDSRDPYERGEWFEAVMHYGV